MRSVTGVAFHDRCCVLVVHLMVLFDPFADESIEAAVQSAKPVVVAGLFKRYLLELPDPVVPEQLYANFIDAMSKAFKWLLTMYRTFFYLKNYCIDLNLF